MVVQKTWETTSSRPRPSHEAQDGVTIPYTEAFDNGQMYPGDPTGGVDEVAGCSCIMSIDGTADETPTFESIAQAEDYLASKYDLGDLTGVQPEDLSTVQDMIAEVDRIVAQYPALTSDPEWRFLGIGTYETAGVPGAVLELGSDAFAVTRNTTSFGKGPAIWLNTLSEGLLSEGTGMMGEIGFTAEKSAVDAIIHEMGHAVMAVSDYQRVERGFLAYRDEIYGAFKSPLGMFMRDTGSIYAGGPRMEEAFATVFYRLNAPGGLDGLSKAAIKRLRKLADRLNEWVGMAVL